MSGSGTLAYTIPFTRQFDYAVRRVTDLTAQGRIGRGWICGRCLRFHSRGWHQATQDFGWNIAGWIGCLWRIPGVDCRGRREDSGNERDVEAGRPRSSPGCVDPPSPLFSQVFILKDLRACTKIVQVRLVFRRGRYRKRQHGCRTPRNARAKPGSTTCLVTRNKNAAGSERVAARFLDAVFYEPQYRRLVRLGQQKNRKSAEPDWRLRGGWAEARLLA